MARYMTDTGKKVESDLLQFDELPLNLAKIAEGFNIEGIRVEKAEDLKGAYEKAFAAGKPVVIDVVMDGTMPIEALQNDYRQFNPYNLAP